MRPSEPPARQSEHTPPAALRAALLTQIAREPSPTRQAWRRRARRYIVVGYLLSFLLFVASGAVYVGARPTAYVAAVGCGWGVAALLTTVMLWRSARTLLGTTRALQLGTIVVAFTSTVIALSVTTYLWPNAASALADRNDLRCTAVGALYTIPMLVGLVGAFARSTYLDRPSNVAVVSASAWLLGGLGILLRCDCAVSVHLALGHVLPLIAGTAITCAGILVGLKRRIRS
jgi:hypothetical protein